MDKDEALQMCLEYIETDAHERKHVRHAIKAALAQPAQEPPKYAIRAYWEDGRIGVVATVERPDGGVHLLNAIIDPPKRKWAELTDEEMEDIRASFLRQFLETWEFAYKVQVATQAKLKERNT